MNKQQWMSWRIHLIRLASLLLENSTISGNFAAHGDGGGVMLEQAGNVVMVSSTIAFNTVVPVKLSGRGAGLALTGTGDMTIHNSLINQNLPGNTDCFITSSGTPTTSHNLVGQTCDFFGPGDDPLHNPLLLPLADNGGPTQTHAFGNDSHARDTGDPAGCIDLYGHVLATDQRGGEYVRAHNGRCDRGAYEFQPPSAFDAFFHAGFE